MLCIEPWHPITLKQTVYLKANKEIDKLLYKTNLPLLNIV